jgi:uncharacterized repeat protein (TIGR03803 family)
MLRALGRGSRTGKQARNVFLLLLAAGLFFPASSQSQTYTFTLLHSFAGAPTDGAMPAGGMIFDTAGNLYGTTVYGGSAVNAGAVFSYSPASDAVSISFAFDGNNGFEPGGALTIDGNGNVYGIAQKGGTGYCGVLFEIPAEGSESTILNFGYTNVCNPNGGVGLDPQGDFYGVGSGQLFEISPSGGFASLYSFMGSPDGALPMAIPLLYNASYFFGTTAFGGLDACDSLAAPGCGTVYEYSSGGGESILYSFTNYDTDGSFPMGTPVMDAKGNLYGTTYAGGVNDLGIIFELSPPAKQGGGWTRTTLHQFSGASDGAHPSAGLVMDSQGNIYGTTYQGIGKTQHGTVFKFSTARPRKLTTLHNFAGPPNDGAYPAGALALDANGNLYGITQVGGNSNLGTLYRLSP